MSKEIIEIFVVIKDGSNRYYLLKVKKQVLDIYCFLPDLGFHFSRHEKGESHFQSENQEVNPLNQPPILIMTGEAGVIEGKKVICSELVDLGCASRICAVYYSITSLNQDYRKFNRNPKACFVIEKELFPKNTTAILVNVWAVPTRNEGSFDYNNPDIREDLLYKVTFCEPQIWIYVEPAG